jgi:hypothetical protein
MFSQRMEAVHVFGASQFTEHVSVALHVIGPEHEPGPVQSTSHALPPHSMAPHVLS